MPPPPIRHLLPLLAISAMACGESDALPSPTPPVAPPDAATSGTSLTFEPSSTITLAPGEPKEISVTVNPPDMHLVRFALLGESLDASLDADRRFTEPNGRTSVTLTAPGSPTTFRLRASAGESATAEVAVSVSSEGFATIRVFPSYKGIRNTPAWTASAVAHSACTDIPGQPPQDGPIVGVTGADGPAVLAGLPVGPRISITLRSQKAVGGCTEITDLHSGETRDISVKVSDIPVKVDTTRLALTMEMTPDGSAAWPLFQELSEEFLDTLFPPNKTEARAVLDAMQDQVLDQEAFAESRMMGSWDSLLATRFDEDGQLLSDSIRGWIERGFKPLVQGKTVMGKLEAIPSVGNQNTYGALAIDTFHGLPHKDAGLARDHVVSLLVEPGDVMIVGGKLTWLPSKLIAAAGDSGAALSGETNAVHALTHIVSCNALAPLLETTHALPNDCAADCIQSACENGLAALWNRAKVSSATTFDTVHLSFTVSGNAVVNGDAIIVGLDATWIGTQTHRDAEAPLRGSAIGSVETPQSR